jgi:hypothetical protein
LFERSATWSFARFNLASGGEAQFINGVLASGSFFETFGVPPLIGRTFSDADDVGVEGRSASSVTGFGRRDSVPRRMFWDGITHH